MCTHTPRPLDDSDDDDPGPYGLPAARMGAVVSSLSMAAGTLNKDEPNQATDPSGAAAASSGSEDEPKLATLEKQVGVHKEV